MFVIQHIWTRWTKVWRGSVPGNERPRPEEVYPLPEVPAGCTVFRHEVALVEDGGGFAPIDRAGPVTADEWKRPVPHHETLMRWRIRGEGVEVSLDRPYRLQTKFPRHLPSPLLVLRPGEVVRIDWNGRLMRSLFGSNRSTYYEQQILWLANVVGPGPRLFLDASPRKHLDYRTHIY